MPTSVNHNTKTSGTETLRAVPLYGNGRVQILRDGDKVGETMVNPQGEWQQSFSLDDGKYTVRYLGPFRPSGKGSKSQFLQRVLKQDVSLTVRSPIRQPRLHDIASVRGGKPKKNHVLMSNGNEWSSSDLSDNAVDLENSQQISGLKTFVDGAVFKDSVLLEGSANFSSSSIREYGSDLVFADKNAGQKKLSELSSLAGMNDVIDGTPTAENVLIANGSGWVSVSPSQSSFVRITGDQEVSGKKIFSENVTLPMVEFATTGASITTNTDSKLSFTDSSGTYLLEEMALIYLVDLCDVIDSTPTNYNLLMANGETWQSITREGANIVTIETDQTIEGNKNFSGNVIIDGSISGASVDTNLGLSASHTHVASSLAIKEYIDEIGAGGGDITFNETPSGSIDGINDTFILVETPIETDMLVFLNGILQRSGSSNDYVVSGTSIVFTDPPNSGDVLLVTYRK